MSLDYIGEFCILSISRLKVTRKIPAISITLLPAEEARSGERGRREKEERGRREKKNEDAVATET